MLATLRFYARYYSTPLGIIGAVALIYCLLFGVPSVKTLQEFLPAVLLGATVGATEVALRYKDEPLKAIVSPWGLVYICVNGALSLLARKLISDNSLGLSFQGATATLVAGVGANSALRTRIVTIKASNGSEVPIGPDIVLTTLVRIVDQRIDRYRAALRRELVMQSLVDLQGLGTFAEVVEHLSASLYAFQSLDDATKAALPAIINDLKSQTALPDDIKFLIVGFVFLTIVGDAHYKDIIESAKEMRAKAPRRPTPAVPQPSPPPSPIAPPPPTPTPPPSHP